MKTIPMLSTLLRGAAALFSLVAAGAGPAPASSLDVNDTLNAFQLYGKDFVSIDGDAETSQGGSIGSDKLVDLSNNNVLINGNLSSGGDVSTKSNVDVAGYLNARGDVTMLNDLSSVSKWTNVGGKLSFVGGNPTGNAFQDSMWIGSAPISAQAWSVNTFAGKAITGPVDNSNKAPGMVFGSNRPFPTDKMVLPDTVVDFDATRNCVTVPGIVFNMSMCGLGGNPADTILPPGRYGDWTIASGNTIHLASGLYRFRSLRLLSDGTRFLFIQPGHGVTRLLIHGNLTVGSGDNVIAPANYKDPPGIKVGTVLIYVNGSVFLDDDNRIWATVVSPHKNVVVETGLRLYGQIFGKSITVLNGFKGGPGFGGYIPLKKPAGFKYTVIHYQYKE